jgi:hypothetical protein
MIVPARSGRTDAQVRGEVLDSFVAWIDTAISVGQERGA